MAGAAFFGDAASGRPCLGRRGGGASSRRGLLPKKVAMFCPKVWGNAF